MHDPSSEKRLCEGAPPAGLQRADMLLEGGTVISMDTDRRVFVDGAVAIRGERIVAVGPRAQVSGSWTAERVINTDQAIVLPGLVCTHSHAFQVLYRGLGDDLPDLFSWQGRMIYPLSAYLGAEETYVSTLLCCMELMKTGTTTFADCFYIHIDTEAFGAACEAAADSGIRAVMGRASLDQGIAPEPFKERVDLAVSRTDEAMRQFPWEHGRRIRACVQALNEHAASADLIRALKQLANRHGAPFQMHAGETRRARDEIHEKTGMGVFEYLDDLEAIDAQSLFFHAVHVLPAEIDLLKKRGAFVSHNPVSNAGGGDVAPIPAMVRAGVNVSLGVDGAASNNGQDMLKTMKFTALIHPTRGSEGLSSETILEMATIDGARALGMEDEVGSLEVGKKADAIIIRRRGKPHLSPGLKPVSDLIYCVNGSDVDTVIVGGTPIVEDRHFTRLDEEAAMRRVDEVAREMIAKAGVQDLVTTPTFRYIEAE